MNIKRRLMGILIVAACLLSVSIESFGQLSASPRVIVPIVKPGQNDFFDITAGGSHTCAIKYNGNVYCWGLNSTGQVGIWTTTTPCQGLSCITRPAFVTTASQVDAGMDHTCALSSAGAATCWGNSTYGQVGNGNFGYQSEPLPVWGNHVFSSISAGMYSTCGTASDGLICWGAIVDSVHGSNPVQISSYNRFSSVSVGYLHACTLDAEGGLREIGCWGNNQLGQLGVDPAQFPNTNSSSGVWYSLLSSLGTAASRVTTQTDFTCADQTNGTVQCVGANGVGQLGNGQSTWNATFLAQTVGNGMHGASTGTDHACALDASGKAYCWGNGHWGQLGNASSANFSTPQPVSGGLTFRKIAAGGLHTCGITTDNHIFCWGNNAYGQLGVGYVPPQNSNDPYRWTWAPIQALDPQ